jgi:hypothetical protein
MVAGHFFVEAIDLLIDSDLHKLNRDRDERASLETQEFLGQYGIDPSSRRLAQGLRSIRTMDREKATNIEKAQAFAKSVPNLIGQPVDRIMQLIELLENTVGRIDKELFSERTRLSTISTVTRPLSTKWLERWNTLGRPDYNYEEASKQANSMLQEEITNQEQLQRWLANLYDLFAELVIYRGPLKGLQLGAAGRPAGMVGEGNERIYRRNWFSWIEEHADDIMQKAIQISSGDSQSAYASSYSSLRTSKNSLDTRAKSAFAERMSDVRGVQIIKAENKSAPGLAAPQVSSVKIEVTVETTDSNAGNASKAWLAQQSLEKELSGWITTISNLWGDSGKSLNVSVAITAESGTSSVKIPNKSPESAAAAVKSFVKASI